MPVLEGYADADRARWVQEPPKASRAERGAFERDRARVLHSAALRRLAAKTQVVGVGESDFPRTRLTHSLECAQIGRELAAALGADPDLVDAACLAHDLGHPPFGHNGEAALAEFAAEFGGFEGNAQSLRVLTRLEAKVVQADGVSAGLNLTRATLDAATKYPWPRAQGGAAAAHSRSQLQAAPAADAPAAAVAQPPSQPLADPAADAAPAAAAAPQKFGFYPDDQPVFDWMRAGAPPGRRCLEAQVMDWADDVAYSVHDLEDGIHAGHVDVDVLADPTERAALVQLARDSYSPAAAGDLTAAAERLAALPFWPRGFDGTVPALAALKRMTSELIGRFTSAAIAATRDAHGPARLTRYGADLVVPPAARDECAILKAVADRYVMRRPEVRALQARQREQLTELAAAVLAAAPRSLEPWLRASWDRAGDDGARLRVVVDQIASLTDTSAVAWWERWVR